MGHFLLKRLGEPRPWAQGPAPGPVHAHVQGQVQVDDVHVQVRVDDVHVQVQVDDVHVQVQVRR